MHGRPWVGWQHDTGQLIGQHRADGSYLRPVVVVLIPRQCGKTTFAFDLSLGRLIAYRGYRAAYTAQTGHAASQRFGDRITALQQSPLASGFMGRRSAGTERISATATDSFLRSFSPKDGALRGETCDLVTIDEAQEPDETKGHQLEEMIIPTQMTRPRRQLILIGTAGTAESEFLRRYVDRGRDGDPDVALIEYGFPVDSDVTDPAVWWAYHPGLVAGLTDEQALRVALATMGPTKFGREYGNIWSITTTAVIPPNLWEELAAPAADPDRSEAPAIGCDVNLERTAATIVSCWRDRTGGRVLEVVDRVPPNTAARRLVDLRTAHAADVWLDESGPAGSVFADLTARDRPAWLHGLSGRPYAAACSSLFDDVLDRAIRHWPHPTLDAAVAGLARRLVGDGWVWSRRSSAADISPFIAATCAAFGLARVKPAPARPMVYSD